MLMYSQDNSQYNIGGTNMKTKIMLKYYRDVTDYIHDNDIKTRIVYMDITKCTQLMGLEMVETGLIIVAYYM